MTANGNLGSSTNTVFVLSSANIGTVKSASAWAEIATGTSGTLKRVWTTSDGFHGVISAYQMDYAASPNPSGLTIAGDLDADVVFGNWARSPLHSIGGALTAGHTLSIGDSWTATTSGQSQNMTIGSLEGQIILNAANSAGTWSGPIVANGYTLQSSQSQPNHAPYYERVSADLGGGAVGFAPFHLYDTDCVPANNSTVTSLPGNVIRLRFYGPVDLNADPPVSVAYTALVNGAIPNNAVWDDITDDFTFETTSNPREVLVVPGTFYDFGNGSAYRVTASPPDSDAVSEILCGGVTGTPSVADFTYTVLRYSP